MEPSTIFTEKTILPGLHVDTSTEAITALGNLMVKEGYVKETFIQSTIEREKEFSTGLPLGQVNIALPHTDSIHVIKQGIALGTLEKPVDFRVMGDPEKIIPVRLVFLLAIKEDKDQVKVLKKLIDVLQIPSIINCLLSAESAIEIKEVLISNFFG